MQVRELMTANPACCTPDSTLRDVAMMMEQFDCGCIPVVDGMDSMRPVGTITDRDIAIRAVAMGGNPTSLTASDIMTADIATVAPHTSLEQCLDVMEDREIRRVLVVDEHGKCCGIVAQADIVQSDLNPARTNKVIREISESAPSRNPGGSTTGRTAAFQGNSHDTGRSMMSGGTLVPLLVGLGSGVALMYLLNSRRGSADIVYSRDLSTTQAPDLIDLGNEENIGKYTDADEEIEKRQQHLQERFHAARTESGLLDDAESANRIGDESPNERGRTAGQGG